MHRVQFLLIFHHISLALLGALEVKAYRTEGILKLILCSKEEGEVGNQEV